MTDSIDEAIRLLDSECQEIDKAIVRLSLRKQRLQDSIRILRDRSSAPLTDTVQPTSTLTATDKITDDSKPRIPTASLVRQVLRNSDRWLSSTDLCAITGRPQTQVGQAIIACLDKQQIERREIVISDDNDDGLTTPRAKYEYKWINHADLAIVK